MAKLIIGLTGSFGSGCTHIAKEYIEPKGFSYISLSDLLREEYRSETGSDKQPNRQFLQDFGNKVRQSKGVDFLAQKAISLIEKSSEQGKWVIDSIRNPYEVQRLHFTYGSFYLFGVFADYDVRWRRVKHIYSENEKDFRIDDARDSSEEIDYGQRVRDCYMMADVIISNNVDYVNGNRDQTLMRAKIERFLDILQGKMPFVPFEEEALMAMAYANSLRSSCLKRKVGAIIVDNFGNIFSSGYNEVPMYERDCKSEWGECYRDRLRATFAEDIRSAANITDEARNMILEKIRRHFKLLDYCRALHAEENAILNVARFGSSVALRGATLYTTTYPCNLCANKIVQVGISQIIYLEPYPMEEAKNILTSQQIDQKPFEGVTFNGYFRLSGGRLT